MALGVIGAGIAVVVAGVLGYALSGSPTALMGSAVGVLLVLFGWVSRAKPWGFPAAGVVALLGTLSFGWRTVLNLRKAQLSGPSVILLLLALMTVICLAVLVAVVRHLRRESARRAA